MSDDLATGGLVPVAGGPDQDAAVTIQPRRRPVGRPAAARRGGGPRPPHGHVFAARGAAELEGAGLLLEVTPLAGRCGRAGLTAADDGAEILIWATA